MSVGNGIGLDHRQIFAILDDYYNLDDAIIAEKEAEAKAKVKAKSKAKKTNEGTTKKVNTKNENPAVSRLGFVIRQKC